MAQALINGALTIGLALITITVLACFLGYLNSPH
jgi:hypothetical protein